MKSLIKFISIFIGILFFTFYHLSLVKAHEVGEIWILINDEVALKSNTNPNTSALLESTHYIDKEILKGEEFVLKYDKERIEGLENSSDPKFNTEIFRENPFTVFVNGEKMVSAEAEIEDIYFLKLNSEELKLKFEDEGVFFFNIEVQDGPDISDNEDFSILIGKTLQPNFLKVNEILSSQTKTELTVNGDNIIEFSIVNADFVNFNYYLDLGDGELVRVEEDGNLIKKRYLYSKFPVNVTLRKEDKESTIFADSYVKLVSSSDSSYRVETPSTELDPDSVFASGDISNTSNLFLAFVVFTASALLLAFYFFVIRRRKRL